MFRKTLLMALLAAVLLGCAQSVAAQSCDIPDQSDRFTARAMVNQQTALVLRKFDRLFYSSSAPIEFGLVSNEPFEWTVVDPVTGVTHVHKAIPIYINLLVYAYIDHYELAFDAAQETGGADGQLLTFGKLTQSAAGVLVTAMLAKDGEAYLLARNECG